MSFDTTMAKTMLGSFTPDDQAYASIVATYFGGSLEMQGFGGDAGPIWQIINLSQESLAGLYPQLAFQSAIDLIMLDENLDISDSNYVLWLQGNGLQVLIDERIQAYFTEYLSGENGNRLLEKIESFISAPVPYSQINEKEDLSNYPDCYRAFISVLLAFSISSDSKNLSVLRAAARERLKDPEFMKCVGLYTTITDTKKFAEILLSLC